jgi:hypothetical protein
MDDHQVLNDFMQRKIITIDQLVGMLECSTISARRRLKAWKALNSINRNGRYYTLPRIPVFDENGLWRYQAVLFSRHGNLKQTIVTLIQSSPKGLSAAEIATLVDLAPNSSFISQLRNAPGVKREKHAGRFLYLSNRSEIRERQMEQREVPAFPSDTQAVAILVQFIKHPGIGVSELAGLVADQGIPIEPAVVQRFLNFHDLLKKTPDTRP